MQHSDIIFTTRIKFHLLSVEIVILSPPNQLLFTGWFYIIPIPQIILITGQNIWWLQKRIDFLYNFECLDFVLRCVPFPLDISSSRWSNFVQRQSNHYCSNGTFNATPACTREPRAHIKSVFLNFLNSHKPQTIIMI